MHSLFGNNAMEMKYNAVQLHSLELIHLLAMQHNNNNNALEVQKYNIIVVLNF